MHIIILNKKWGHYNLPQKAQLKNRNKGKKPGGRRKLRGKKCGEMWAIISVTVQQK